MHPRVFDLLLYVVRADAHYVLFFFFFKQKTAYEIGVRLVGSEMCIRDRFGLSASFAAGLGMVSVFCGVTNSPLTSLLLAYELFGGDSLALFALPVTVAYMLSGYYGLYSEQKILYSKLKPRFIDRKTK